MKKILVSRMIHYFKYIVGCMLILFTQSSFAQDLPNRGVLTAPSPEVISLLRNVMNPVDLYTGVTNVQVPLYTLACRSVQIPISLNYRTSGIKVHDLPTWAGVGWNLSTGGKITRVVRGKPDEGGYYLKDGRECERNYLSYGTNELFDMVEKETVDFEPDLFFFEIPGRSGLFIPHYNGHVYTIPFTRIDILWEMGYFIMKDENGWKYTFGKSTREKTSIKSYSKDHKDGKTETYTSVWYLEKIETSDGDVVNFSYINGETLNYLDYNIRSNIGLRQGVLNQETIPYKQSEITVQPQYLATITTGNTRVSFESTLSHAGITNLRRLDNIKVNVAQQLIKTIHLEYSTFVNGNLRLDEVKEVCGSNSLLLAKFSYNTSYHLPRRDSKDFDHWGYYNGANNSGYRPTFYYQGRGYTGASREPSFERTKADILTKVWNNLGGYTEYIYGPNREGDLGQIVGGVRLDSIKQFTSKTENTPLVTAYKYLLPNGSSSGTRFAKESVYVPPFVPGTLKNNIYYDDFTCTAMSINSTFDLNGSPICYSRVEVVNPNKSKSVYEYTSYHDADCNDISSYRGPTSVDWSYFLTPTSRFWKRGLLKRQKNYDSLGALVDEVENTYTLTNKLTQIIYGFNPIKVYIPGGWIDSRCYYGWEISPVFLEKSEKKGREVVHTITEYEYDTTYLQPKTIQNREPASNTIYKTTIKYPFNYYGSNQEGDTTQFAFAHMQMNHIWTPPVEKVFYKNNKVVGATINEYRVFQSGEQKIVVPHRAKQLLLKEPVTNYTPYTHQGESMICDPRSENVFSALEYDPWGNTVTVSTNSGITKSCLYGHAGSRLVAEVENAAIVNPEYKQDWIHREENVPYDSRYRYDFIVKYTARGAVTVKISDQFQYIRNQLGRILLVVNGTTIIDETFSFDNPITIPLEISNLEGYYPEKYCFLEVMVLNATYAEPFEMNIVVDHVNEIYHGNKKFNQVLYTSFEEDYDAVELPKAKTGRKALKRPYSIAIEDFRTGEYVLTYWKSTDGIAWVKQSERISITPTTTGNKTIGSTSFYIDEVRFIPVDARIITHTYSPGIGKTSTTDLNGVTTYYEYDEWGRWVRTLNNDRRPLKEYEYFIKP